MTSNRDLWAITLKVECDHGDDAPRHIAERIGAAAVAGDQAGIDFWKAVALRFDRLTARPGKVPNARR